MATTPTLVIGNKNYSTWSLRPWMLLRGSNLEFHEKLVSLKAKGLSERLGQFSSTARVPVLIDGEQAIWDSLAICEYVNEQYLNGQGWPGDVRDRATARAIVSEMHSGFNALRNELPMNIRASRMVDLSDAVKKDIQRVDDIFSNYAQVDVSGDLRLFGKFGIADSFYTPVVMRFKTYQIPLSAKAQSYCDSLQEHPALKIWINAALTEKEIVEEDEAGIDR